MIYCYRCPLRDICHIVKLTVEPPRIPMSLNWLPDGMEKECPLYQSAFLRGDNANDKEK